MKLLLSLKNKKLTAAEYAREFYTFADFSMGVGVRVLVVIMAKVATKNRFVKFVLKYSIQPSAYVF